MEIVLAKLDDLQNIKDMYTKIVDNMYENNIKIWNYDYPIEDFEIDIKESQLYILKDNDNILGGFVIYEHTNPEEDVEWEDKNAKAFILNRLGVNVEYLRQGIGEKLVKEACNIAASKGAGYLRLLVSDVNNPAIELYTKCKFNKLKGIHEERIRTDFSLYEYGFEVQLDNQETQTVKEI